MYDIQERNELLNENKIILEKVQYADGLGFMKVIYKPDNYGGVVKISSTRFWEREDYDDGSLVIRQLDKGMIDKTLRFGPLTTTLYALYAMGFHLAIESFIHRKKHSLFLTNGKEEYKLATITAADLLKYDDLMKHVKDQAKPDYRQIISGKNPSYIIKDEVKEVKIETDPFEELMLRYPLNRKPVEFVGNQTVKEYVKQQLKEHRRLHYVE